MRARNLAFLAGMAVLSIPALGQDAPTLTKTVLKEADAEIAKIVKIPKAKRTFENTVVAFDDLGARVDSKLSMPIFLQNVSGDPKVREKAAEAEEIYNNWAVDLGQREDVYKAFLDLAAMKPKLGAVEQRLLDFNIRDYRRSGMSLPKTKRARLAEISKELNKLGTEFDRNIADDDTKFPVNSSELTGVPEDALGQQTKFGDVYLLGLDYPTYDAVMTYCTVSETRQKMQWLYRRKGGQKNVDLLQKILPLRWEEASLLSYKNPVDYYVETRMAKNSATIKKFYDDLLPIVKKKAEVDIEEYKAAKREMTGDANATLNAWDNGFVNNYLRRTKYAVDSLKVAEYFPMDRVVAGLFSITEQLYGVKMTDVTKDAAKLGVPIWHSDVKLYAFTDKASGKLVGHMLTDLYPRPNKYSHAACWGLRVAHKYANGTVETPLVSLVCNFTKGTPEKPSLLPHDEVETFFHEFGHGLHGIFSESKYARFAGTGVARDFVEAPSQMMENWVWSPTVLKTFAKHYKTGETIPDDLIKSMVAARTLGSGIDTMGQIFLGQMDQTFHLAPGGKIDTTKAALEVYARTMPFKAPPGTFPQASFGHLVGYEGAYYGYLWSLVYASDMFQRFESQGVLSPETGAYYRSKILAKGGTMDEFEMLKGYLGREPKVDAFLSHLGLKKD